MNVPLDRWSILVLTLLLGLGTAGCSRQAKRARHLERADRYFTANDYAKAEIEYLNALRAGATNVQAFERLGTVYYAKGDFGRAFPFLLHSERHNPENLTTRTRLASIYLLARKFSQAREQAMFVLGRQPTNAESILILADASQTRGEIGEALQRLEQLRPEAARQPAFHLALGNLQFQQSQLPAAAAAFQEALRLDPGSTPARIGLGNVFWQQGELSKADQAFEEAAGKAKASSLERLKWIEFRLRTGAIDQAKEVLQRTIQEAPDFLPAKTFAGEIALVEQEFEECAKRIEEVLAKDANNLDALLLRARLMLARRQTADALAELERLVSRFPRSAKLHYLQALAHLDGNDTSKAFVSLTRALAADPDLVEAVLLRAELDIRKGDPLSAITSLSALLQRQPQLKKAHSLLGAAHVARGSLEEAVAIYRRLLELDPGDRVVPVQLAATLRRQRKTTEARAILDQLLAARPDDLQALGLLVEMDVQDKDLDRALQRAQDAVRTSAQSAGAHFLLAKVYLAREEQANAETTLRKVLELDAGYQAAYAALARLYVASDRYEQALQQLESLFEKNPSDSVSLMLAGTIYDKLGRFAEAVAAYQKVIALQPRFALAMNNLAYLYSERLGDPKQAYELAQRAREISPLDPYIADTFGWVLYRQREFRRAIGLLQEAQQKLSAEPEVLFHAAMAHYALGEEEAARRAFARAIEMEEAFPGKAEAERCLTLLNLEAGSPNAIGRIQERLSENPNDTVALLRLAAVQEREGDFVQAKATCERILDATPGSVTATIRLAELHADRLHDGAKALQLAKLARNLAPDDPEAAFLLGRLALAAGDHEWALSLLQESARKRPEYPEVAYQLAWGCLSTGRLREAHNTMKQAAQSKLPSTIAQDAKDFITLTGAYLDARLDDETKDVSQRMLAQKPDYLPALLVVARRHEAASRKQEAKAIYERILKDYPLFAPAAKHLVILYSEEAEDLQRAVDLGRQAREAFPADVELAKALGKIAYRRGDYRWAAQLLKQSAKQREADAELFYFLGLTLHRLKASEEGAVALRHALALNDKGQLAVEARRVLAELR